MAYLALYRDRLLQNYGRLNSLFTKNGIAWGIVTKLVCGNRDYLKEILSLGIREVHDSRISNLKAIKQLDPEIQTVYIKPPPKKSIAAVVTYADVSLNTELSTIRALSEEAGRQNRLHKVIIMIEMGDLREGVMRDDLLDFYHQVFGLPHIQIIGLGTNLNCLHGVMPSADKLIQLSLYKQLIDLRFNIDIPWVSGGTTVTLPLLIRGDLPVGINHFRIGEALYFGADLFTGGVIEGMRDDVFELYTEILEIQEKPMLPSGELGVDPMGRMLQIDPRLIGKTSYRAILDIGYLDVNPEFLLPTDESIRIVDASSDMLVVDVGQNPSHLKVGDEVRFGLKYMGALGIMNSRYIEKRIFTPR
jgi:predicted amino acid racemase